MSVNIENFYLAHSQLFTKFQTLDHIWFTPESDASRDLMNLLASVEDAKFN